MFGLFKPRPAPEGPVEFAASVEIARPASEVYALIDWADPRNAKRATGNEIVRIEGQDGRFDMAMPFLPDLTFEFIVTEAVPHSIYAFGCVIRPGSGAMAHSHERYEFEDLGDNRCRVDLLTKASFVEGLSMREFSEEIATMSAAVQSALQKLKLQAEHGADVAKALEENTVL
ncbi:SRPBCC family protein [Qipengyuania nanhaisediminis]|uniref:SRPBCC family protein n=1 Tax=Qipengyuania nanhaisediminis TaxID=604088 RepID=UPI0038B3C087